MHASFLKFDRIFMETSIAKVHHDGLPVFILSMDFFCASKQAPESFVVSTMNRSVRVLACPARLQNRSPLTFHWINSCKLSEHCRMEEIGFCRFAMHGNTQ